MDRLSIIVILLGVVLGLVFWMAKQLEAIQAKLEPPEEGQLDQLLDKEVSPADLSLQQRLEKEKSQLPQIDLWAIDANRNWEADLIAGAEGLRDLIVSIGGDHPDSHVHFKDAKEVPMDYYLAHELATLAHLKKDISIKQTEWVIKKTGILWAMRMHQPDLSQIAWDELDLIDLAKEIERLQQLVPGVEKNVWKAFEIARDRGKPPAGLSPLTQLGRP